MAYDPDIVGQSLDPTSPVAQSWLKSNVGFNPAYATPEQMKYLRDTAAVLQKPGTAKSWMEVIGNMAQTGVGALMANRAAAIEQAQGRDRANPAHIGGNVAPTMGAGTPAADAPAADAGKSLASFYSGTLGDAGGAALAGGFGHETAGTYSTAIGGDRDAQGNPTSLGYAQWHDVAPGVGRKTNVTAYAQKYGKDPTDPDVQRIFPLVEMGFAGDPSDPGYGTERKAGLALKAARTPQEATAAALMYERPKGWTPKHPENASGYAQRLAYATALMGGRGGAAAAPASAAGPGLPQPDHPTTIGGQPLPTGPVGAPGAGAGDVSGPAMAYAPAGGDQPPALPEVPQKVVPLRGGGAAPAVAPRPAGPVVAQNVPRQAPGGGAPFTNLTPEQLGWWLSAQGIDPEVRRAVLGANIPGYQVGAGAQVNVGAPGQTVPARPFSTGALPTPMGGSVPIGPKPFPEVPGIAPGTITYPSGSAPVLTPTTTGGGAGPTRLQVPGPVNANDITQDPLAGIRPIAKSGQRIASEGEELGGATAAIIRYKDAGKESQGQLGRVDALEDLGKKVGTGIQPMIQNLMGKAGFATKGLGDIQAYQVAAMMMVPGSGAAADTFREAIPTLSATPEGRAAIAANLRLMHQYNLDVARIANDDSITSLERQTKISQLPPPKLKLTPPDAGGGGGTTAARPAGKGPVPVSSPEEARKLPSGTLVKIPDGRILVVP